MHKHVAGSYCQNSFLPDCPIIRIFDLQHQYPIPRETLRGGGKNTGVIGKFCDFRLKLLRDTVVA